MKPGRGIRIGVGLLLVLGVSATSWAQQLTLTAVPTQATYLFQEPTDPVEIVLTVPVDQRREIHGSLHHGVGGSFRDSVLSVASGREAGDEAARRNTPVPPLEIADQPRVVDGSEAGEP